MRRSDRRGFSLLVVMLVVALLAIIGTVVLTLVDTEYRILGMERAAQEARFGAEAATMEVLNDEDIGSMLPGYSTDELQTKYTASEKSAFGGRVEYEATISLIRDTPIKESSLTVTRAFLYEVRVGAEVGGGDAFDEVNAEIYKVFSMPAGTVLPDDHAR